MRKAVQKSAFKERTGGGEGGCNVQKSKEVVAERHQIEFVFVLPGCFGVQADG